MTRRPSRLKLLRTLWGKSLVLGLTAKEGVPTNPKAPSLACRMEITATGLYVSLFASHASAGDWVKLEGSNT